MKTNKIFVLMQMIFIVVAVSAVFISYPRVEFGLDGNEVSFRSINSNVIIISNNPDFSNPRYIDIEGNVSFNLKSGVYYWKAGNGIIQQIPTI